MLRALASILFLVISSCLYSQNTKENFSVWQSRDEEEVIIASSDYTCIKKGNFCYFISNNDRFVYLYLKFEDKNLQNIILMEGLTLWVDMDNKDYKKLGIKFPVGMRSSDTQKKPVRNNMNPDVVLSPIESANTIELIGFVNENMRRFPAKNADTFSGSVKIGNDGALYYSLAMPVEKLPIRNARNGVGAMPFTLGIEYSKGDIKNNKMKAGGTEVKGRFNARRVADPNKKNPDILTFWIKNIKLATEK